MIDIYYQTPAIVRWFYSLYCFYNSHFIIQKNPLPYPTETNECGVGAGY